MTASEIRERLAEVGEQLRGLLADEIRERLAEVGEQLRGLLAELDWLEGQLDQPAPATPKLRLIHGGRSAKKAAV